LLILKNPICTSAGAIGLTKCNESFGEGLLNLKHLYYFYIFSQELSTTRAARRLSITPPALSNQLKQLDDFVGVPLTRRVEGKVVFTEQGEVVLHYSERMFAAYEELRTKLSRIRGLKGTRLRIGVCESVGARFSFDLLALLTKSNFLLAKKLVITFDSSDALAEGFLKDEFDIVLGAFPPDLIQEKTGSISKPLIFPVRLFGPSRLGDEPNGGGRKGASIDLGEIIERANSKKIPLIFPQYPCVLRHETEKFLATSKVRPQWTIECNNTSGIVQLIERDIAMGFLPAPCLFEFRSIHELTVLGPAEGFWSHGITFFAQKSESGRAISSPDLSDLFLSANLS
jgi:DNA-binding transcriptional LysR family regulator